MLGIALPKGRLGEKAHKILVESGITSQNVDFNDRKLIIEDESKGIKFFWVKPSDVTVYVERGAADIGIAGKDIILENNPDVFELLDLKMGKCKMAVAGRKDFKLQGGKSLSVATKFPNIAKSYFRGRDIDIDVVKLNGSIELAPLLNLSDVIVDIVETGTTLRENNLIVLEEIVPISARLISNKISYKFKKNEILPVVEALEKRI